MQWVQIQRGFFFLIVVTQHNNHSEAMEKYFKASIGGQTEQRQGNHRQYFYTKGPDQRRESDDFGCVTISYLLDLPIRLYNILKNSPPPLPTTTTTTSLQLISSQFFIRAPCFVRLTPPLLPLKTM